MIATIITKEVIINNKEYEKLFGNNMHDPDIGNVITRAEEIIESILWNMLFTSVGDDLYRVCYIDDRDKKVIHIEFQLETSFFMKHFGRLVPDLFKKETTKLMVNIKRAVIKVDWAKLIQEVKE
jgi:hypothetical protein